ncbi:mCG1037840, isoform CRA_a, partial [Mus musculus]
EPGCLSALGGCGWDWVECLFRGGVGQKEDETVGWPPPWLLGGDHPAKLPLMLVAREEEQDLELGLPPSNPCQPV